MIPGHEFGIERCESNSPTNESSGRSSNNAKETFARDSDDEDGGDFVLSFVVWSVRVVVVCGFFTYHCAWIDFKKRHHGRDRAT